MIVLFWGSLIPTKLTLTLYYMVIRLNVSSNISKLTFMHNM
jgi:hypothetical protein